MLFVSLTFLFLFLPLTTGAYYALKNFRHLQNLVLFLASLFFYAWGEPKFVIVLLFSIICNWAFALLIDCYENTCLKRFWLIASVILNLGLLFAFKYLNFFVSQINKIENVNISVVNISLPIGISFYTFQAISYVVDVYRGERCHRNILDVGLYISFFPQLIAGPIVRYNSISKQIENRIETFDGFKTGIIRFAQGFSKKVLLSNTMALIADKAFEMDCNNLTVCFAWLGAISYTLQIYFDFSGYSDMAVGLGRMFGFEFEENFNYPYVSSSVTEFWKRWHISLSRWFKDYIYIPIGGNRTGNALHNYFNLLLVWFLTGIWHGANWTFILWGLLYFVALMLEKATPFGGYIDRHRFLGHIYTLLVVNVLWVLFRSESISHALTYITTMFGLSKATFYSAQTWVYIKENMIYLLIAIVLSVGGHVKLRHLVNEHRIKWLHIVADMVDEIFLVLFFIVSIVYIINGTYNPFIYFHF